MGLIGPNGAGKSTTVKAILGLLKECRGEIRFTGETKRYAYVPEQPVTLEGLTLEEHLELAAAAFQTYVGGSAKTVGGTVKLLCFAGGTS